MSLDGFFIHHLVLELKEQLEQARLDKIASAELAAFSFMFYRRGQKNKLIIQLEPTKFGIFLTQKEYQVGEKSQFLLTLKKHLEGSILINIEQYQTDRVIILHFQSRDFLEGVIQKSLVFEAMGRHSNLLLIKQGVIIDCYKKMFFETGRQLIPNANFEHFGSFKQPLTELNHLNFNSPKEIVDRYLGISPLLSNYIFEKHILPSEIKINPTKNLDTGQFYVFNLFETSNLKHYSSISALLDDRVSVQTFSKSKHKQFLDKKLTKELKKIEQLQNDYSEALEQINIKNDADALYSLGIDLQQKMSSVIYENRHIHLDPTLTINENAQKWYKSYQKAKRKIQHLEAQIDKQNETLEHINGLITFLDLSDEVDISDLEQELVSLGYKQRQNTQGKKNRSPNILKVIDDEIEYYIGKNNVQNEYVTHELAHKNDFWFHVKGAPGSHVIVKTTHLNENIIRIAAMLAAKFSKMRFSQSIPVDYTQVKHVRKISGRAGHEVTYRQEKTIFIDIDEEKIHALLNESK
jgi:predicted ribosome quality control (RQC) complex YloA/Tae2 family protein